MRDGFKVAKKKSSKSKHRHASGKPSKEKMGKKLEHYIVLKVVGKGAFGKAILVRYKGDNRTYIMKQIDIYNMKSKERKEALNEVKVLSRLRHPNIVRYRTSFMQSGKLCIIMDFAEGGDLYQKIKRQRGVPFSQESVMKWMVQLCLCMKYIHDKRILHRDLKTQNIFLDKNDNVKLGDFGIARVLKSTMECAKTLVGTPYYLSPELCREEPYNNKSDVWSLGCVLYELMTLKHAFEGANLKALVGKILRGVYPAISSRYSRDLRGLVDRMLQKSPTKRPSINSILKFPFVQTAVTKYYPELASKLYAKYNKPPMTVIENASKNQEKVLKAEKDSRKHVDKENAKPIVRLDKLAVNAFKNQPVKEREEKVLQKRLLYKRREAERVKVKKEEAKLIVEKNVENIVEHIQVDLKPAAAPAPDRQAKLDELKKRKKLLEEKENLLKQRKQLLKDQHRAYMKKYREDGAIPDTEKPALNAVPHVKCVLQEISPSAVRTKANEKPSEKPVKITLVEESKENAAPLPGLSDTMVKGSVDKFRDVGGATLRLNHVDTKRDSLAYRIESLRMYLEDKLGPSKFYKLYRIIMKATSTEEIPEEVVEASIRKLLKEDEIGYVSLVHQLLFCETSFNESQSNRPPLAAMPVV